MSGDNERRSAAEEYLALAVGVAMTLMVRGYQFGQSNHTVYLLDALRRQDPELLKNDWWTSATLQYHGVFSDMSALLMRWGVIEQGFLIGYLALVVLLHVVWLRLTRILGGTHWTYVLSVTLYYISAGGVGLGMYHFMQDSSFLPSNVASVAMLWGIYLWIAGRSGWAGLWLGVAALFHLNYAVVALALWGLLSMWRLLSPEGAGMTSGGLRERAGRVVLEPRWLLGSALLAGLAAVNLVPAVRVVLSRSGGIPLEEFVDLYVRLRHPHHYDPSTWGAALWVSFLWPVPLALIAAVRSRENPAVREAGRVFAVLMAILLVALLGAGIWFVSESLIQMSLYRFSIYAKLLSCVGAAYLIWDRQGVPRGVLRIISYAIFAALVAAIVATLVWDAGRVRGFMRFIGDNMWPLLLFWVLALLIHSRGVFRLGDGWVAGAAAVVILAMAAITTVQRDGQGLRLGWLPEDDADYLAMCDWAADEENTPKDAVFLVPPAEQIFRLRARRAIVVNFKGVPQLSGEIGEWRARMERVLGVADLRALPGRFDLATAEMQRLFDARSGMELARVAERYSARYVLATRGLSDAPGRLAHAAGRYHLYDLAGDGEN